jgi:hypothetical protein
VTQVLANADGIYTFSGLQPGDYYLIVATVPSVCRGNVSPNFTVLADATTRVDFLFPCPNAAPPSTPATVLGGLVTRNGEPMDGITITVTIGAQTFTSTTGGAGTFQFGSELLPGGVNQISATVLASGFPSNCTGPTSRSLTIRRAQEIDLAMVVTCGAALSSAPRIYSRAPDSR